MSFLPGRLAATEGAYFRQESKQAVNRLQVQKNISPSGPDLNEHEFELPVVGADVLHEVLRHSLPPNFEIQPESTLSTSKWLIRNDSNKSYSSKLYSDAHNPLRAYVSLPQVTMGPKRWQLPAGEHSISASTANSVRRNSYSHVNPEKLKAAAEGFSQIGKAFLFATTIVFGGAVVAFRLAASKLELNSSDDIKTKGRDIIHSKFVNVREKFTPLRIWAEDKSRKWHFEKEKDVNNNSLAKELSKRMGTAKTSN
ncbi:hypothetical protein ACHQM5_017191 [Ranunculus cassubicifolius]